MEEATQSNPVKSEGGWRLFLLLPRLFVVQTSQKRQHPQEHVGGTIPGFRRGSMVAVVETKQTMCGIWLSTETAGATHHDRMWTDGQCAPRVWSRWGSCQQGDKHWKGHSRIHSGDCLNLVSRSRDLSWTLFLMCRSTSTRESLHLMCALRDEAAARPSGMTVEDILVLDNGRDAHLLFSMAEQLSRAHVPPSVTDALRLLPLLRLLLFSMVFGALLLFVLLLLPSTVSPPLPFDRPKCQEQFYTWLNPFDFRTTNVRV